MTIEQYEIYWVDLNPTQGAEINKVRPCVIISPPEMNQHIRTVIIAPVTKRGRQSYPTRIQITTENSISGWIVLDQIRAIDKSRLRNKISSLNASDIAAIKSIIQEMLVD
ncbi:type II toxin-antitoxin system PemK/MazF family toxin [Syntrophomonas wolfei]|uniref:mRNA interferase n=1 Tax=Syntrophomonas wolfei subsp. wolfei (strain DSM 2245B / Goettingen) TaxID=335541 RepID=Q0AVT0_SYNWW|nr:type II toxin-antitoxin system PemK/MazF family toxin [Syntrophomonas wolfei]ABI69174.1 transcriptional modulator of MazE/toxin, MazF [Syntrophomonas wolfei subsp. wolfei str. Goettingen G311]